MNPQAEIQKPAKKPNHLLRQAIAAAALVGVTVGGVEAVETAVDHIQTTQQINKDLHNPNLYEQVTAGNTPAELQAEPLAAVEVAPGETASDIARSLVGPAEDDQNLTYQIFDQTEGQPGTAVVPVSEINPAAAHVQPAQQSGELPTVVANK